MPRVDLPQPPWVGDTVPADTAGGYDGDILVSNHFDGTNPTIVATLTGLLGLGGQAIPIADPVTDTTTGFLEFALRTDGFLRCEVVGVWYRPLGVTAPDYAITLDEDTSIGGALIALDGHAPPLPLVYTVLSGPTHGTLTLNADGTYIYDAARAYWGPDSFSYTATEDVVSGLSDTGTVTITVVQAFPLTGVVKVLLPPAELQFCDANGVPYAGGTLEFYEPGTSNPKDTWRSPTGDSDTLNENPLTLDAAGRALIYGDGGYRTVLRDADGNLVWDQPSFTYVSSCMVPVVGAADLATARQAMGITDAIEAEALLRIAADDAERTAREAADAALGARIDDEIARAEAAEAALGARIDGLPAPNPPVAAVGGEAALDAGGHCRVTFGTPFATACTAFVVTGNAVGVWSGAFNIANQDRFGCDVWGSIFGSRTPAAGVVFNWMALGN